MKFPTALLIIAIIFFTPTSTSAQTWSYWNYGPGYSITRPQYPQYYHGPYGGGHYRPGWTNYRVPDTSWGYRTHYPTARELGIRGHRLGHPNPRSLYR